MVKIPEYIQTLVAYKAGKALEDIQQVSYAKLASNENPLGPSPNALRAIDAQLKLSHLYPDPSAHVLTQKLSEKLNLNPDSIVCGNGSDALLEYAVMSFSESNDEILTSEGTFIGIYVIIKKLGRKAVLAPLKNWGYDLNKILSLISSKTKIIYLANPNNPTGTYFTKKDFDDFLAKVPKNILVILDEAYVEYAQAADDYPNGLRYENENILVLRTFSKVYGLAGLRVGYGFGSAQIIQTLRKVKLPFEPSRIGQIAATHALDDEEFLHRTLLTNERSKQILRQELVDCGVDYVESIANFFMLIFPDEASAKKFNESCAQKGLYLRHLSGFGLPQCVRMNTGTEKESIFAATIIQEAWRSR